MDQLRTNRYLGPTRTTGTGFKTFWLPRVVFKKYDISSLVDQLPGVMVQWWASNSKDVELSEFRYGIRKINCLETHIRKVASQTVEFAELLLQLSAHSWQHCQQLVSRDWSNIWSRSSDTTLFDIPAQSKSQNLAINKVPKKHTRPAQIARTQHASIDQLLRTATQFLVYRCRSHQLLNQRAKRFKYSSRSNGHTLPAQGKETSSESGKSLSVTALQRRLSCTSSCVFITTAVCITHANMHTNVYYH